MRARPEQNKHSGPCDLPVIRFGYLEVATMKREGDYFEVLYAPVFSKSIYPNAIAEYRTARVCNTCAVMIAQEDAQNIIEEIMSQKYASRVRDGNA